ncbi:hypothetical protein A2Z23_01785 [Candidatus Curtissbacteria bacterium RBG_16_39_7]|uniref:Membrane protein 6-pyruvoyl-tetrahydropterin synthase-related domain-containing protein n=1 Tax=Candidatus Curtissbacteria bacterium RBG_16_39_7 TaxID=1797707 RepID=A0A1F5G243_9BACT|nr:MAG: hypothetical protein A2Z23_01785 [Candidatus Curtissbacteria bacterium RBG_16_39_7]
MASALKCLKIAEIIFGFIVFPVVIIFLNYRLIWPQLTGEFTQHLGSIEVSYISMAKFISDFWPNSSWQPFWYFGFPMHVFYTPLLPFLEILGKVLFGWSFSHGYRFLTGLSYVLIPAGLYFFGWYLSGRKISGLVAAFVYSFLPSILAFLFSDIRADYLAADLEPRRYTILVRWGEGPHTFALFFVPLAALFFLWALRSGTFKACLLAAVFIVLTALTNAIGLWAIALLALSLALGELVRGVKLGDVFKPTMITALLSIGLAFFWYNPSFLKTFFREGGGAITSFGALGPWGLLGTVLALAVLFFVIKFLFKKANKFFPGLPHSLFWFVFMFLIVYIYYASGEDRIELVPQALRLNTEADMALAIVLGVLASGIVGVFFELKFQFSQVLAWGLYFILGTVILVPIWSRAQDLSSEMPKWAQPLEETGKSLEDTSEYKVAKWAEVNTPQGTRVIAPGNYGFFLNYFVDVPQLRGALYQSSTHRWPDHIYYQLANGKDADVSLAWLKIGNISNLIYTTGGSQEMYKDYKVSWEKFDGILTRVEERGGDIYYQVPLSNPIPAKVVDLAKMTSLKAPFNAIDKEPIFAYLSWMEEKSDRKLEFQKINNNRYSIKGDLKAGEGILVQMTYDPGWIAKENGKNLKIARDSLGFLVIEPQKGGQQEIILNHKITTFSTLASWLVTIFTVIISAVLLFKLWSQKPQILPPKETKEEKKEEL